MNLPRGFKAKANSIAVGLRRQMGLSEEMPINLDQLAEKLGLPVVSISTFVDMCPEPIVQLVKIDPGAFSALLLRLDRGSRIILVNDGHSVYRRNSSISHEIAHALLAHPPTQPFDYSGCRNFDKDMEDQANCLSAYILIPNEAASHIVWSRRSLDMACRMYGVSPQMLEYRLNTSGARIRKNHWQQRHFCKSSIIR